MRTKAYWNRNECAWNNIACAIRSSMWRVMEMMFGSVRAAKIVDTLPLRPHTSFKAQTIFQSSPTDAFQSPDSLQVNYIAVCSVRKRQRFAKNSTAYFIFRVRGEWTTYGMQCLYGLSAPTNFLHYMRVATTCENRKRSSNLVKLVGRCSNLTISSSRLLGVSSVTPHAPYLYGHKYFCTTAGTSALCKALCSPLFHLFICKWIVSIVLFMLLLIICNGKHVNCECLVEQICAASH